MSAPPIKDPCAALRRVMRERSITLQQLADATSVSASAAWRWVRDEEAKRSRPDPIVRVAIERLYGIPADAWLTPDERKALTHAEALQPTGTGEG